MTGHAALPPLHKGAGRGNLTLAAILLLTLAAIPSASAQNQLFADPIAAKGKGFEIKRSEVEEAYLKFKANAAANGQTVPDTQREDIEKRITDRLVILRVVSARATAEDKAESAKKAEKFMEDTKQQASSEASFKRQLTAMGMSLEQFKADILERALVEQVIERELKPKINVTDAVVKKFYDENPAKFEQPEMVKMLHVHVSTVNPNTRQPLPTAERTKKRELIDKTLARAKVGEDFKKLVTEISDDMRTKEMGGEYTVAKGTMEPAFAGIEAAAFSLRPGQISAVLESAFGYHLIKVTEKIPAKQTPFAEISERLREALRQQEVQKMLPDYMEQVKKEAGVEIISQAKP